MDAPRKKFFITDDGKQKLTCGKTELQAGIDAGKHTAESLAWTEGMTEWLPLANPFWEKHGIRLLPKPPPVPRFTKAANPLEASVQKPQCEENLNPSLGHGAPHTGTGANGSTRTSEMALASLLCGIALVPILPVILGHIAIGRIHKSQGAMTGKGLAVGGLALGYLCLFVLLVSGGITAYKFEEFFASSYKKPEASPQFTSVEFDADDTGYSPAETHSMNQLSKELTALKERLLERESQLDFRDTALLERESQLDSRESAITMDLEALQKQMRDLDKIKETLNDRLTEFESKQGKDISKAKLQEYQATSRRWFEMGPEAASIEIQNWRQKRRFEEALTIFETLKAEDKAPIIAFMLNSDQDALIELADALAMRDRGLLPSLDLEETPRNDP